MITPQYVEEKTNAKAPALPDGLDSVAIITERAKAHKETTRKDDVYQLRLLVADRLGINGKGDFSTVNPGGKYPDVDKSRWEEGRFNDIQNNTAIQVKSLSINDPDISWSGCTGAHPEIVAAVRRSYYLRYWRDYDWKFLYQQKLLDILVSGEGNTQCGVRDGKPFMEYLDFLNVTWDPAYKDPCQKRYVFVDKPMPLSVALKHYPAISDMVRGLGKDGTGGEESVMITFYWSRSTAAVLFKGKPIDGPRHNPYGRIPVKQTTLLQFLSMKHSSGVVEGQIGAFKLLLTLTRYFRSTTLKSSPVAVAVGPWDKGSLDDYESGEEGVVLRANASGADFKYAAGAEIQQGALVLFDKLKQHLNAASGVNDFMRSQTDTKVDFASQLALMAQQSGVQGKFTAQIHEEGLKEDARLFMTIAARFERDDQTLKVGDSEIAFNESLPVRALLGDDGEIAVKPMEYKSPAQKLQETMILGNVLNIGATLPGPLQVRFYDMCLTAFEVEDKDELLQTLQEAMAQQQMAQAAQAAQAQQLPQTAA